VITIQRIDSIKWKFSNCHVILLFHVKESITYSCW